MSQVLISATLTFPSSSFSYPPCKFYFPATGSFVSLYRTVSSVYKIDDKFILTFYRNSVDRLFILSDWELKDIFQQANGFLSLQIVCQHKKNLNIPCAPIYLPKCQKTIVKNRSPIQFKQKPHPGTNKLENRNSIYELTKNTAAVCNSLSTITAAQCLMDADNILSIVMNTSV